MRGRLDRARGELGHAGGALRPGLLVAIEQRARERLKALWRVAEAAHPNRPLERGYARVEDRDGRVLVSAEAAREAQRLSLVFADGRLDVAAGDSPPRSRGGPARGKADQPKLL